jgi:hypothetical protein
MSKHDNHGNEGSPGEHAHATSPHLSDPYWKRAHRDWRFWVGLFFMLLAITIYVLTDDLSIVPHYRTHPKPLAGAGGLSS